MIKDLAFKFFSFIGRWLFGYVPFPEAIEERAIAETLAYLDSLLLAHNPQAWAQADAFLLEQLSQLGGLVERKAYLLSVVRDRFDPRVLAAKFAGEAND